MTSPLVAAAAIPAFVNPRSGTAERASEALTAAGKFEVQAVEPDRLEEEVRAAAARGAPRIVVAGGDGSIATAADALAETGVELAVLPGGTLNHFAGDLGIPTDASEAVRVAASGRCVSVDVARVNGRIFLNTSSVGSYVRFVRTRERFEKYLGYRIASLVAAARTAFTLHSFRVQVEVDGERRVYVTPVVFIGVGERELKMPTLGRRVANGQAGLHVFVVRGRTRASFLAFALAAVSRGVEHAARTPLLDAFLVDSCTIDMRRPRGNVAVDGEIMAMNAPLDYRLARGALKVVVPA